MQITNVLQSGKNYQFKWPGGDTETYPSWIEYRAIAEDGEHKVIIGYGTRPVYGQNRVRVIVWIDEHPHAEFFSADDFDVSGDVISEIRIRGDVGEVICRYPTDPIPERYTPFKTLGLPTRVDAKGVHNAWAIVANISDHKVMIALAGLRRMERSR